ncbi:hypothetical protein [Nocardia sp. NPDC050710]|uniref:hypothetical protein n=1 Tax=Nocardia sp. NPDC050710 TaxID=3157220 RepID=UPI0033C95F19
MTYLKAEVVRWADDSFPGFVEIEFRQADDSTVRLVEKAPVLDCEDRLTYDAAYPVTLELGCDIAHIDTDRRVAAIELHWDMGVFDVPIDLLGDLPDA